MKNFTYAYIYPKYQEQCRLKNDCSARENNYRTSFLKTLFDVPMNQVVAFQSSSLFDISNNLPKTSFVFLRNAS